MHSLLSLWYRLTATFRRRRLERDLEDEMAFHVAMRQERLMDDGIGAEQARGQAERRFGNRVRIKEQMRDLWTFPWFESIVQDAVYAVRTIRSQPGVAAIVVLVLGTVVGLNTTLFTVLSGIVWRPWPGVTNPDAVVRLYLTDSSGYPSGFSVADARSLDEATTLAGTAFMKNDGVRVGSGDAISPRQALLVSRNFFPLLGIRLAVGRGFAEDEDRAGAPSAVAVITFAYWQAQFGGDPAIVGSAIQINDRPFTIIGVMAPDAGSAEPLYDKSLILPISALTLLRPSDAGSLRFLTDSSTCCADVVARLRNGVSRSAARSELDVFARRFTTFSGNAASGVIVSGTEFLSQPGRGDSAQALGTAALLTAGLLLVWLIACANVGNLLLSKAAARVGEIGTKLALGAGRYRLVCQLLLEGFILALLAGAVGLAVAFQLPFLLFRVVAESGATGYFPFSVTPDLRVLGFAIFLAGLSAIAFGLAPALYATRTDVGAWLKYRDAVPATRFPLRSALLAVQAAVSVVLLVSAGLLVRGAQHQAGTFDPGFTVDEVSAVSFELPEGVYDRERATAFFDQIDIGIKALPILTSAFSSSEPFSRYRSGTMFYLPGETRQQAKQVLFQSVSRDYLRLLNIPLRAGRDFDDGDAASGGVIINESMARRYWAGENPVGKTFQMRPRGPVDTMVVREIVGVVQNTRANPSSSDAVPMFYQLFRPGDDVFGFVSRDPRASQAPVLLLKTKADVSDAVRSLAARLDSRVRVQQVALSASRDAMLQSARWGPILAATLGLFALLLTTVGVSGVFGYAVRQRRREIGIRLALGAAPAAVVRLVLARHARALGVGLVVGLLGSVMASIVLRNRLHGLSLFDPVAYLSVAALLACCALAAGLVPARRATRINPVETLRQL